VDTTPLRLSETVTTSTGVIVSTHTLAEQPA
jgi:hypothetical protein